MATGITLILQIIWANMTIAILKARLALPANHGHENACTTGFRICKYLQTRF